MNDVDKMLVKQFLLRARQEGYSLVETPPRSYDGINIDIYRGKTKICTFDDRQLGERWNLQVRTDDSTRKEIKQDFYNLFYTFIHLRDLYMIYEAAEPLRGYDQSLGYRAIAQYNNCVLAVRGVSRLGEPADIDRTIVTGADGTARFTDLPPGTYSFEETQPPFGYNNNNDLQTAVLQSGQVLHKEIRNYRKDGLFIKKTDQNGAPLPGAVFELRRGSGEVLLSEVTNENGLIYRGYLVEDLYIIEEIQAPEGYLLDENPIKQLYIYESDDNKEYVVSFVNKKKPSIEITKVDGDTPTVNPDYFITDGEMFYAELKIHDDLVKFKVVNKPVHVETSVEKRGVVEAMAGSSIYYDFNNISNGSNVALEEFYWHDVLPTEAVRLEKIWTGVWSERVKMELQIKTNLKTSYRTVKKNLLSTVNNEIDCSRSALGLAANEYVTEFRIVFGEVQPGFHETTGAKIQVRVLDTVENGRKFTNKTDVGGRYIKEWVYDTDGWTVVTYNSKNPKGDLPKTGL